MKVYVTTCCNLDYPTDGMEFSDIIEGTIVGIFSTMKKAEEDIHDSDPKLLNRPWEFGEGFKQKELGGSFYRITEREVQ